MPQADAMEGWPVISAPTESEIARVRRHAVALGGAALQNPHSNRTTVFQVKDNRMTYPKRVELSTCDEVAEFTVPLDRQLWQENIAASRNPDGERKPTGAQALADGTRYCVVDDSAHLWPRFQ